MLKYKKENSEKKIPIFPKIVCLKINFYEETFIKAPLEEQIAKASDKDKSGIASYV